MTNLARKIFYISFFILYFSVTFKYESSAFLSRGSGSSSSSDSSSSGSSSSGGSSGSSGNSRSSSSSGSSNSRSSSSDTSSSSRVREAIHDKYHRIVDKNPSSDTSNSRIREAISDKYHRIVDKDKEKESKLPKQPSSPSGSGSGKQSLPPPSSGSGSAPYPQQSGLQPQLPQPQPQPFPQQPYPGQSYSQQPYPAQQPYPQQPYQQQPYPQQPYQQQPYPQQPGSFGSGTGTFGGYPPYSGSSSSKSGKMGLIAGVAKKIFMSSKHKPKNQYNHNYHSGYYNGYNYRPEKYGQVRGQVCRNLLEYDGIVMGEFMCPIEGFNLDETECCGPVTEQYCCTPREKAFGSESGGGTTYMDNRPNSHKNGIAGTILFWIIFIPVFIISIILCGVCIFCCYKKRIYQKVPGFASN